MGIFDRIFENKSEKKMTKEQKIRQNYAIINYYKKKNDTNTFKSDNINKKRKK